MIYAVQSDLPTRLLAHGFGMRVNCLYQGRDMFGRRELDNAMT
jgi:hypothetical protein